MINLDVARKGGIKVVGRVTNRRRVEAVECELYNVKMDYAYIG